MFDDTPDAEDIDADIVALSRHYARRGKGENNEQRGTIGRQQQGCHFGRENGEAPR